MNKKIISLIITGAMLASTSAVFAAEEEISLISDTASEAIVENPIVHQYVGTVIGKDDNTVDIAVETEDETVEALFDINSDTLIYDINGNKLEELKEGDKVKVLSTAVLLTKDIKPVNAIIVNNDDVAASVYYDTFSKSESGFISADNELVLNIDEDKQDEYDGKTLLVFYNMMTMSIPAQTSPTAIVEVNNDKEEAVDTVDNDENEETSEKVSISFNVGDSILNINGNNVEVETPYVAGEGVTLVPLRVISEAFGADVEWDGETQTVSITYGEKSILLQIDNSDAVIDNDIVYQLEVAPQLTENGFTMVPLRFISESFGADVGYDEETRGITVELNK